MYKTKLTTAPARAPDHVTPCRSRANPVNARVTAAAAAVLFARLEAAHLKTII
jgi:hypothetical protein